MHLRVTIVDPDGDVEVSSGLDVVVTVATGTSFGSTRATLIDLLERRAQSPRAGEDDSARWFIGARALLDSEVWGQGRLLHGAVLVLGRPGPTAGTVGLLELHAIAGPDAGAVHRLVPGEHVLGRAAGCGVRVVDPDLSRVHAVLSVSAAGATLRDAGSTNGTLLDGAPVGSGPVPVAPGALLRIGSSVLSLTLPGPEPTCAGEAAQGRINVNRPPRLLPPRPQSVIEFPLPPSPPEAPGFPLVATLVPLVLGGVLVLALGNLSFALFLLLSPVMLLATHLGERRSRRRRHERALKQHRDQVTEARSRQDEAVEREVRWRRESCPDPALLLLVATGRGGRLWERRRADPDFLALRLGTADLPSHVEVRNGAGRGDRTEHPPARFVPVGVSLAEVGVLGLAGRSGPLDALVRHVVAHVATLHSPLDVRLVVLTLDPQRSRSWRWAAWLPHTPPPDDVSPPLVGVGAEAVGHRVAELLRQLDTRQERLHDRGRDSRWAGSFVVVVYDGARSLRSVPGVARLLAEGPAVGILAVCVEPDPVALPAECAASAVLDEPGVGFSLARQGRPALTGTVDAVTLRWAERLGRALAPLRDATPDEGAAALPETARLLDLLPYNVTDPAAVAQQWRETRSSTCALLGVTCESEWSVDLAADGPHALVAGTTGAGKSELLQTLIASLALANPPDALAFVLVDYKGGSAFQDCARLPHAVGLVTDLDGPLTERALTSLTAELQRRERLLRAHGVKDLEDYVTLARTRVVPPLPRLVLVVDEFATLAEELPDFVGGLVGIAQRGRSLGLHLVLATQRPSGVVSADIRANTNLRVCLRVTDPGDSIDVIDCKDAALLTPRTPGRGYVRTGGERVAAFQTARVGGHATDVDGEAFRASVVGWDVWQGGAGGRAGQQDHEGPTDLCRIVDAVVEAAQAAGIRSVESPWLPPLPTLVTLEDLSAVELATQPSPFFVPLALADLPTEQRHDVLGLDLGRDEHLLIAGGPRSGRSSALRTVAAGVAERLSTTDAHVYVLDGGSGGLAGLTQMPHVGCVVGRNETARGRRLVARLLEEVHRRRQVLARQGFSSAAEQRAAFLPRPGQESGLLPWMVLLVDGWEAVCEAYDQVDHGRPVDDLLRLLREGPASGLRAVVTGDRSAVTGRLGSVIGRRLLLRFADPGDFALAGIPPRLVPVSMPAGRGLLADPVLQAQVALLAPDPAGPAQLAALEAIATRARRRVQESPSRDHTPIRVQPLPPEVTLEELEQPVEEGSRAGTSTIGVGGDDLLPVRVTLPDLSPAFVVAGPHGSGRSTALVTIVTSLLCTDEDLTVVVVEGVRGSLRALTSRERVHGPFSSDNAVAVEALLSATPGPVVVAADDVEQLRDTPVEHVLLNLLRRGPLPRLLLLAADAEQLVSSYRGLAAEARRHRCGLQLQPGGGLESELFGTRVERVDEVRPGRGALVLRGHAVPVQVARSASSAASER